MKRLALLLTVILVLTGCKAANGNSVSKLETTIYKTNNHEELIIEDGFNFIKNIFTEEETFYHSSLLTMEYGVEGGDTKENTVKTEIKAYDVLYITFTFETGDVEYISMESNHKYNYEAYLIKNYENDSWHIYKMEKIN